MRDRTIEAGGRVSLSATPNPVPAGLEQGTTTLTWDTGGEAAGQVYVSKDGESEELVSAGRSGSETVSWIAAGSKYEFRLYAGLERRRLLESVTVERDDLPWRVLHDGVMRYAASGQHMDEVARLLGSVAWRYAYPPTYEQYFRTWEERGFHLTPVHFYQPIPDTRTLDHGLWSRASDLVGLDLNEDTQLNLVRNVFPAYRDECNAFAFEPSEASHLFYFNNPQFSGTDALILYCMVRHMRPRLILEIGSGFSSRVSAQAAIMNGDTRLVCVDPYDDGTTRHEALRKGFPGLAEFIPERAENLGVDFFDRLSDGDILFIDSSHISRIGSDVNFLFLEVLPRIKPGVIIHVHDIFIPFEYPAEWVLGMYRFFNEQYLLRALLTQNPHFEIMLCNYYLGQKHKADLQQTFPRSPWWGGTSCWFRRRM